MSRIPVLLALTVGLFLSSEVLAGKIQTFNYRSDKGLTRVCKGDTSTGEAICVDGAAVTASASGTSKPKWVVDDKAKIFYLKYSMGQKKSSKGRYAFFVYYTDRGAVRVCAGDTATGVANCADGTAESAQAMGTAQPTFEVSAKARIFLLKYFNKEKGQTGRFGFMSYRNNRGLARICRSDTNNGSTLCVDGTAVSATVLGKAKPKWKTSEKVKLIYFKY